MKATTVDEYIEGFPEAQKAKLIELRKLVRERLPDTDEMLKWGAPAAVEKDGMILIVFSGHKDHMNFVATPSTKTAFETELKEYITGKGSVQLAYDKPIPVQLITKMLAYRAKEYREHKVNWR